MRRILPFLLAVALGCSSPHVIEARFGSKVLRSATRRVQTFVFGPHEGGAAVSCAALDPRGLARGDAAARAAIPPAGQDESGVEDVLADLTALAPGTYTLVIEAWGPTCAELAGGTGAGCLRFDADAPDVIRGYYCNTVDLAGGQTLDIVADLEPFIGVGAEMEVPRAVKAYPAEAPLEVASGEVARLPFVVRLLDVDADELEDTPVHFSVVSGRATIVEAQPIRTTTEGAPLGAGIAAATLRVGRDADAVDGGMIVVEAYAPGFDRAPLRFYARAVSGVDVTPSIHRFSTQVVQLDQNDYAAQPLLAEDIDDDGEVEFVTVIGHGTHRVVVFEPTAGGYDVRAGPTRDGQARAIELATLTPGTRSLVVSVADVDPGSITATPDGDTYVVEAPRIEIHDVLALDNNVTVIDQLDGAPLTKIPITITAADFDGDGLDDLAMAQCSYVARVNVRQSRFIECYSKFTDFTDSELAVWLSDGAFDFRRGATVPAEGNDGGFREIVFGDVDGDSSLDLVTVGDSNLVGICGQRNQPRGLGFETNERFSENISFAGGYAVAAGHFDDDERLDFVATGGIRAASPVAGIKVLGGGGCERFRDGPDSILTGPKTIGHQLSVRTADLNGDAYSDVIMLHGSTRLLRIFLGGGALGLAAGSTIELPSGTTAGLAVAQRTDHVLAGVILRDENALAVVRIDRR